MRGQPQPKQPHQLKQHQTNPRNPKRLPALVSGFATLSAVTVAEFPSLPRLLVLGVSVAGRHKVYALPPGTRWQIAAVDMTIQAAERIEKKFGASFLEHCALTVSAPGYRPTTLPIHSVRMLRETLEALERYEGGPLMLGDEILRGKRPA